MPKTKYEEACESFELRLKQFLQLEVERFKDHTKGQGPSHKAMERMLVGVAVDLKLIKP